MTTPPEPRYPIYIISKGRADIIKSSSTVELLLRDGVPFRLVVEPTEADAYAARWGRDVLAVLPFHDRGAVPTRNWVWDDAAEGGHHRHWILDDNIRNIRRLYRGQRLIVDAHYAFAIIEDFTDRYENIGISGMNYLMFVDDSTQKPMILNCHVYSTLLIRTDLPYRWRGWVNEDTDLNLQVLSGGWCTVAFNVFCAEKVATSKTAGGNTESLYQGDGRLHMARQLERRWPYAVGVGRRWDRPQHKVRGTWRGFDTPLRRRTDIDWDNLPAVDEFGMRLEQVKDEVQHPMIRKLLAESSHDGDPSTTVSDQ